MSVRSRFARSIASAALAAFIAVGAQAAETNVSGGFAVHGYDPVAYFTVGQPTLGRDEFVAVHDGATYRFASAANRDAFLADPAKYAPQYGGFCAYGTAKGRKFDVEPDAWHIADGKLYLNFNKDVNKTFLQDVPRYVRGADGNWQLIADVPDAKLEAAPPAGVKPVE